MKKLHFKSIILSDVHLGTAHCKINEVNHFLKRTRCELLILNGDIIDGWQLRRSGCWTKGHSRFLRLVLKRVEKDNTRVVYLRGNHDDVLRRLLPLRFENIQIRDQFVLENAAGHYLVLHGDVFDAVTTRLVVLAHIGDIAYQWLLNLNRLYDRWRAWRGLEQFSLSQFVKARVKSAVNFVCCFEEQLVSLARKKGYRGVICGHIHTAADKEIDGVHYINSGDWVESMTAVVEHFDGRFELITYSQFTERLDAVDCKVKRERPARETDKGPAVTPVSAPELFAA